MRYYTYTFDLLFIILIIFFAGFAILRKIWLQRNRDSYKNYSSSLSEISSLPITYSVFILVILFLGWYTTSKIKDNALISLHTKGVEYLDKVSDSINAEFNKVDQAILTLSGSPSIQPVFDNLSPENLQEAHSVLDRYASSFNADIVYLMDLKGKTIAASNRHTKNSVLGKNYAFRPYFTDALKNGTGHYLALGVTTSKKGYYSSRLIFNAQGKGVGVAVMKRGVDYLEHLFLSSETTLMISPEEVIFLCNKPEFCFRTLYPISDITLKKLELNRQFGEIKPKSLFDIKNDDLVPKFFEKRLIITAEKELGLDQWKVVTLMSINSVIRYQLISVLFIIIIILIILSSKFIIAIKKTREYAALISLSQKQFKNMFEYAPEAIFLVHTKNHKILETNLYATNWLKLSRDEIVFHDFNEILCTDTGFCDSLEPVLSETSPVHTGEYRLQIIGNIKLHALISRTVIQFNQEQSYLIFMRDITKLKEYEAELTKHRDHLDTLVTQRTEELTHSNQQLAKEIGEKELAVQALAYSEKRFRETSELLPNIFCELDSNLDITYINKAGEKHFYPDKNSELSPSFIVLFHPQSIDPLKEQLDNALKGNELHELMVKTTGPDYVHYFLLNSSPVINEDSNVCGLRISLTDITTLKNLEQKLMEQNQTLETRIHEGAERMMIQEKSALMGKLATGIIHDINNPMSFIYGNVQILRKLFQIILKHIPNISEDKKLQYLIDEIPMMLDEVLDGCTRIMDTSERLRKITRRDHFRNFDLIVAINSASTISRDKWKQKCDEIPIQINTDQTVIWGLESEIVNALTNILMHSAENIKLNGKISIVLSETELKNKKSVKIEIMDNGKKTNPQIMNLLSAAPNSHISGEIGLGLILAHEIITEHKGTLNIYPNQEVEGNIFIIILPLKNE